MPGPTLLYPGDSELWTGDPNLSITGTGNSIPWGVDAIFQYNGLIFNDRSVVDKIRVLSIEGLDDADVRDNREDTPSDDGEVAYDSHYSGRTIVFNGRIEAYQRDKLHDMRQALSTAFSSLTEKPLYFLTGTPAKDHYINCRKSSKLQYTEEQTNGNVFFRDFQLTLRASNPRFLRYQKKTISIDPDTTTQADISNLGNYHSEPVITFHGGLDDVGFDVEYSGEILEFRLKSTVSIADNDFYRLDVANRTLKNKAGENKFGDLDEDSDLIYFPPGASTFVIPIGFSTTTSDNGSIQVVYRDSYK